MPPQRIAGATFLRDGFSSQRITGLVFKRILGSFGFFKGTMDFGFSSDFGLWMVSHRNTVRFFFGLLDLIGFSDSWTVFLWTFGLNWFFGFLDGFSLDFGLLNWFFYWTLDYIL